MSAVARALPIAALLAACQAHVLSGYGSLVGANGTLDGQPQSYIPMRKERHDGVDIRASVGDPVIASADGRVTHRWFDRSAGWVVAIAHPRHRLVTKYVHLRSVAVEQLDVVRRGQLIGEVGLFPYSAGLPHVHWMLCSGPPCHGHGSEGRTADPLELGDECFDTGRAYPRDRLVLTLPIQC